MNGERELSQKFNLNPTPESICLKNGNTDDMLKLASGKESGMEIAPGK